MGRSKHQISESSSTIHFPGKPQFLVLLLLLISVGQLTKAEGTVTPRIEIRGVIVDTKRDAIAEAGYVTTVSPGILIDSSGPRSDVSIDYALQQIFYHDLEQEDREVHRLALRSEFRHRPGRWVSNVNANNRLINGDIDGLQTTYPDIISDNSDELLTVGARSTYSDRIRRNLRYSTSLGIDHADLEGRDATLGYDVNLAIDNLISEEVLTWRGEISSRVIEDDSNEIRIDEFEVIFNYRLDRTLSAFVDLTTVDTELAELNEDSGLVGLRWQPSPRSFASLGIGKRGDEDVYDLSASLTRARSNYSARYSESVGSVRDGLFESLNEQFAEATSLSTEISLILRKRADVAMTLIGIRSDVTISFFRDEQLSPEISNDREVTGAQIVFNRRLSPHSVFSVGTLAQESEFTEKTTLEELRVGYERAIAKNAGIEVFLSGASFDSTNIANTYDQGLAGASIRATF